MNPRRPTEWMPILEGDLREVAIATVHDIAAAIRRGEGERRPLIDQVLFWAYAGQVCETTDDLDAAISDLIAGLEAGVFTAPGLFGGLAGAGWVLQHVCDADAARPVLEPIDEALLEHIARRPVDFDVISGLSGIGVYFLERRHHLGVARVVERLLELARTTDHGTTWHCPPELLPPWQRERSPDGHEDCGVAHGTPGVIAFLARAYEAGADPRLPAVCRDATRWLLAQRLLPDPRGRFPTVSGSAEYARTAWCYGELGIAATLWGAAVRFGEPVTDSMEIADACASRPPAHCYVFDAGLCHGASGLAHLLNRFFQASGKLEYRTAATRWFERTLALRREGGVGGFWVHTPGGEQPRLAGADFLEGAIGTAFALLAAATPHPPGWDRLLLCNVTDT